MGQGMFRQFPWLCIVLVISVSAQDDDTYSSVINVSTTSNFTDTQNKVCAWLQEYFVQLFKQNTVISDFNICEKVFTIR